MSLDKFLDKFCASIGKNDAPKRKPRKRAAKKKTKCLPEN